METKAISQFDLGYVFNKDEINAALSREYLAFLKEAGIADSEKTPNLFVAGQILRRDRSVENKVKEMEIRCDYSEKNSSLVRISQPNARKLVYGLGGIVLPTGLMYKLFIPALKEAAGKGNEPAGETLIQMTYDYSEWLEDLVLDNARLKIGTQERTMTLPDKDGYFGRADINEFGYPTSVKDSGEFYYVHPRGDESAVIRYWDSWLGLDLGGSPSFVDGRLGVRFAKFF